MYLSPLVAWTAGGSAVVDLLCNVLPIVCGGSVFLSLFWYALLCVLFSFAIMVMLFQMTGAKSRRAASKYSIV